MYESAEAVCPYYCRHTAKMIKCEGRKNKIEVESWEEAERHIKDVCGDYLAWKTCPIAKDLNDKYGER